VEPSPTNDMVAAFTKSSREQPGRRVRVSKMADARVGVGLVQAGRSIQIAEVSAGSPLEGHVWPGDIIKGVAGQPLPPRTDAHSLANVFCRANDLDIHVETPVALSDARTVFLIANADEPGGATELGITLERDPSRGLARVASLTPGSLAATTVDRDSLARGDLIVAVGFGGVLVQVENPKECQALLAKATEGAIELRVVRPDGWPVDRPRSAPWQYRRNSPPQHPPSPPPAYAECGALSTLTSLLDRSRIATEAALDLEVAGISG